MPMQIVLTAKSKGHRQNGRDYVAGDMLRVPFELGLSMVNDGSARETTREEKIATAMARLDRAKEILEQAEQAEAAGDGL